MEDQNFTRSHPEDESPTAEQMAERVEYAAAWDTWDKVDAIKETIRKLDPKTERELLRQQKEKLAVLLPSVVGADYKAGPPEFDPWAPLETAGQDASAAPPAPASEPAPDLPEPQRRLVALRALGGDVKWFRGGWSITGIAELEAQERDEGRGRISQKTIRADLKEAADAERKSTREGLPPAPWHP